MPRLGEGLRTSKAAAVADIPVAAYGAAVSVCLSSGSFAHSRSFVWRSTPRRSREELSRAAVRVREATVRREAAERSARAHTRIWLSQQSVRQSQSQCQRQSPTPTPRDSQRRAEGEASKEAAAAAKAVVAAAEAAAVAAAASSGML